MVAVFVMGIMVVALFVGFSSGLRVVHAARDKLRATQILTQKMETIRLLKWSQVTNNATASTNFTAYYDPSGTNSGTLYEGLYSASAAPAGIPAAYRDKMRLVNVHLFWTNWTSATKMTVQQRQIQTFVARYGLQNYVY